MHIDRDIENRRWTDAKERQRKWLCVVVLMSGRIRTIEVWIDTVEESTMTIMCPESIGGDFVPLVGHDLDDVLLRHGTTLSDRLLPLMNQCVVQGTHALSAIGRHEPYCLHVLTPIIMKYL